MNLLGFIRLSAHAQALAHLAAPEETLIGGQAVMEGVMMRAPHSYSVAVRKPDGELVSESLPVPRLSEKYRWFKYPILRGIGSMGQSMYLGVKALHFSAGALLDEAPITGHRKQQLTGWIMALNLALSFLFFVFLYKFVPLYAATLLSRWNPALEGRIAFNLVDGLIRLLIFLAFLAALSRWRDVKRLFEYHGAEHKVVFNYESGRPVTVDNARDFSTFHPRCGTSFLLVVMVIAIVVYSLIPFDGFALRLAARVALLPLVAGLSYEVVRLAARRKRSLLALLTAPGLWLQRITTRQPSDDQLLVAIQALQGALTLEKEQGGEPVLA